MANDVIRLDQLGRGDVALAGGKAAHLGELTQVDGVRVPPGFCVSTDMFRTVMRAASLDSVLDRLSRAHPAQRDDINALSAEIRSTIEQVEMPSDLVASIVDAVDEIGEQSGWRFARAQRPKTCRPPRSQASTTPF